MPRVFLGIYEIKFTMAASESTNLLQVSIC